MLRTVWQKTRGDEIWGEYRTERSCIKRSRGSLCQLVPALIRWNACVHLFHIRNKWWWYIKVLQVQLQDKWTTQRWKCEQWHKLCTHCLYLPLEFHEKLLLWCFKKILTAFSLFGGLHLPSAQHKTLTSVSSTKREIIPMFTWLTTFTCSLPYNGYLKTSYEEKLMLCSLEIIGKKGSICHSSTKIINFK